MMMPLLAGVGFGQAPAAAPLPPQTISVPTYTTSATVGARTYEYRLAGGDPAKGGTTTIPVMLVPVTLTIENPVDLTGRKAVLDARPIVQNIMKSPIFANYDFGAAGKTQYIDALMRTEFGQTGDWHTLLGKPEVVPISIDVPVWDGYVMTSKKTGGMLAMVDQLFMQQQIFSQLANVTPGTLVIAIVRDTTYYINHDATECCTWGTWGVDSSTAARTPFVMSTYLDPHAVDVDKDVQPISQYLARFFRDPLHDGLYRGARGAASPGNVFPGWTRIAPPLEAGMTEQPRQNTGNGSPTLDPTDINWKNTVQASHGFVANAGGTAYHLENVALLQWYDEATSPTSLGHAYSFPDAKVLTGPAVAPPQRGGRGGGGGGGQFGAATAAPVDQVKPVMLVGGPNGHKLVGYWSGLGPIRDVSPQWDIILVAFATPDHSKGDGFMQYVVRGQTEEQFKADIKLKQSEGKKVMISLGGGGQHFAMDTEETKRRFIETVEDICAKYGFDGIDIDFEASSMNLIPGDTDPKHPISPTTVNLIAAMREIHDHFGPQFMLSLVPEGQQTSAAGAGYGGQFGSYVPIIEGIRDMLAFTDTQDYNCPPVQGLDGEYYMPGSVDYHAAATEQFLHGFYVGRDPKHWFAPLPADKVVIGYLNSDTTPEIVHETMNAMITGKSKLMKKYTMQKAGGYPAFLGPMFWTIDADRREQYRYSNDVGPELHAFPKVKAAAAAAAAKPAVAKKSAAAGAAKK